MPTSMGPGDLGAAAAAANIASISALADRSSVGELIGSRRSATAGVMFVHPHPKQLQQSKKSKKSKKSKTAYSPARECVNPRDVRLSRRPAPGSARNLHPPIRYG